MLGPRAWGSDNGCAVLVLRVLGLGGVTVAVLCWGLGFMAWGVGVLCDTLGTSCFTLGSVQTPNSNPG
jgi:hypothetical protein